MTFNVGSILGAVVARVLSWVRDSFDAWYTKRQLEVEERRRKALESHHDAEKERKSAEDTIAEAGRLEKEKADKEAQELKHQMMLEHLRKHNP